MVVYRPCRFVLLYPTTFIFERKVHLPFGIAAGIGNEVINAKQLGIIDKLFAG
jgi:hypothetical protein